VAVAPTLRDVFVKPREGAQINSLLLITDKRRHVFELVPITGSQPAALRVSVVPPPPPPPPAPIAPPPPAPPIPNVAAPVVPPPMSAEQLVSNRMRVGPQVHNGEYTVAEGKNSTDLVPQLVFDDGRATYFRFAGNLPLPAVFSYGIDGAEEVVNTRMTSDGLLVADRVARRFVLRAGNSVVAVINEAFDPEGLRPVEGTAVQGVARVLISQPHQVARTSK
jgi:type IV secretion system protein VirB9